MPSPFLIYFYNYNLCNFYLKEICVFIIKMSTVSTIFEQNSNGDMILKFMVNGVEKTYYSFSLADGTIILHKRTDAHVNNYESFAQGIVIVSEWTKKIWAKHRFHLKKPELKNITKFSTHSQYKNNGTFVSVFKIGKTKVINTEYIPQTKIITFRPRPQVTMHFRDFQNLLYFQNSILCCMTLLNEATTHIDTDLDDEVQIT